MAVSIIADTRGLNLLARDLRRVSPEAWKAYKKAIRAEAEIVLRDAQARARQPGPKPGSQGAQRSAASLHIRVTPGGNVKIKGGGDAAPAAAPIENKGKGFVRHPVYGNRANWTSKNSHAAFLTPAFDAHKAEVLVAIEAAVLEAVDVVMRAHI